jgi:hypothetical protein
MRQQKYHALQESVKAEAIVPTLAKPLNLSYKKGEPCSRLALFQFPHQYRER